MGFLGKLFGSSKKQPENFEQLVSSTLDNIIDLGRFELSYEINKVDDRFYQIEFFGEDEELLTNRDGQLLDSFQLYLKRVTQHQLTEERVNFTLDCDGFRDQANQSLVDLAEKLKGVALNRGKPVYFRALPPRDRKVIHQYLAEDGRVKSRSIGDGLYKKIKIYPAKDTRGNSRDNDDQPSLEAEVTN